MGNKKLVGEYEKLEEAQLSALKLVAEKGLDEVFVEYKYKDENNVTQTKVIHYPNLQNLLH